MYDSVLPGDVVLVYFPTSDAQPQYGFVVRTGGDAIDVVVFPSSGPPVLRLSGVWHRGDPRCQDKTALVGRATFLPLMPLTQMRQIRQLLDDTQEQLRTLQQRIASLEKKLAQRESTGKQASHE